MGKAKKRVKDLHKQITELSNTITQYCPHEIGRGDPLHGESACDVAIRLIKDWYRKKDDITPVHILKGELHCPVCGSMGDQTIVGVIRSREHAPVIEAILQMARKENHQLKEEYNSTQDFVFNTILCMSCEHVYRVGHLISKEYYLKKGKTAH